MSAHRRRPRQSAPRPSAASAERAESEHERGGGERLQKVLAAAGIASRRECEELIVTGRVEVDRRAVTELGTKVDPFTQEIRVDGVTLPQSKRVYYLLNKPAGVVCTHYDPSGRTRAIDLINTDQRLFPVGRLDRTSEGLLLITNDGELANRLTHPRYGVAKTYLAVTLGHPQQTTLDKLRQGIHLAEGFARAESVIVKRRRPNETELIIVLKEGRNREIRRMLARVGHKVLRLRRIAIGPIKIGDLDVGGYRKLTLDEVGMLQAASQRTPKKKKSGEEVTGTGRERAGRKASFSSRGSGQRPQRGARPAGRGTRSAGPSKRPQGARPKLAVTATHRGSPKPTPDKRTRQDRPLAPRQSGKVLGFDDSDVFDE